MSVDALKHETRYIVADVLLEALSKANVDYIFAVLGSDHPSIIEAYARRQKDGKTFPRMLVFLHEFVAISAADGYARVTGKPQCVLVHVDAGTTALGQGLQNASSGKSPILILAGQPTWTYSGDVSGHRSEHVQWYQDLPNQSSIMAPYSRYSNEIRCAEHVESLVNRAMLMACTGCPGPVYLTASREILAAETNVAINLRLKSPTCILGGLPMHSIETIGLALITAEKPLVVTGYLGRDRKAVSKLIDLANVVKNLLVFDAEFRNMSFPANHPAWITVTTGAPKAIREADVVVVLDADVPWIPSKVHPMSSASIFHIDLDPRKEKMNFFDIQATATYQASSTTVLEQILKFITDSPELREHTGKLEEAALSRLEAHRARMSSLNTRVVPPSSDVLSKHYLFASLRSLLPQDTIFVSDAVTNQVPLAEQLQLNRPGTNFTKGASGIGWAGGAAIGVKLASQAYDVENLLEVQRDSSEKQHSSKFICMIIGDGAFTFGNPTAVYNAAHRMKTPFLSVILNNGGWKAVHTFVKELHPNGVAASMTEAELGMDLSEDGPQYCEIAKAASAGVLCTAEVSKASQLEDIIRSARRAVEEQGIGALIDAVIV